MFWFSLPSSSVQLSRRRRTRTTTSATHKNRLKTCRLVFPPRCQNDERDAALTLHTPRGEGRGSQDNEKGESRAYSVNEGKYNSKTERKHNERDRERNIETDENVKKNKDAVGKTYNNHALHECINDNCTVA